MILQEISIGSTAWILAAICLVLIMTPGLAMFYGGLLRRKNVLSMFAFCFVAMFIVSIIWFLVGYTLAFGNSIEGFFGDFSKVGLIGILDYQPIGAIPAGVFIAFQCMAAVIAAAILASPFTDRAKLPAFAIFIALWLLIIYSPVCHWVWASGGWLFELGILDFAGGTVVHINVGFASLAIAMIIKKRKGFQEENMTPHNIPMVLMGLGLLWFGWFGFNGAGSFAADSIAGLAIINTNLSACTAALMWMFIERKDTGKNSTIGIATAILAGLIGITPAAGFVEPWAAALIGILTAIPVYYAVKWRNNSKIDESLDAFACHGIGGIVGVLLTGIFASVNGGSSLITGDIAQFGIQILGIVVSVIYSFGIAFVIGLIINKFIGLSVKLEDEIAGLDISTHGEDAYDDLAAVNAAANN